MISVKKQWIIFLSVNLGILLLLGLFPLYEKYITPLPSNQCGSVVLFHLYCPGCGGTRAFKSLLSFDILSSLVFNPIVLILALGFLAYEIYMAVFLIKRTSRKIFFNEKIFWAFIIFWAVYFVVRNILLVLGIDIIGDIAGINNPSLIQLIFLKLL